MDNINQAQSKPGGSNFLLGCRLTTLGLRLFQPINFKALQFLPKTHEVIMPFPVRFCHAASGGGPLKRSLIHPTFFSSPFVCDNHPPSPRAVSPRSCRSRSLFLPLCLQPFSHSSGGAVLPEKVRTKISRHFLYTAHTHYCCVQGPSTAPTAEDIKGALLTVPACSNLLTFLTLHDSFQNFTPAHRLKQTLKKRKRIAIISL